ncbi:RCC1-like domain-containing protein [Cohnella herbarum]|uniref:RCC1-like domain-containing protein n=1 Tax=Cohnella herbarum TaxID=2728023 RepID=UPI0035BF1275
MNIYHKLGRCPKDTIAAGWRRTVGFKSDGTVVTAGHSEYGQCDVSGWLGISRHRRNG